MPRRTGTYREIHAAGHIAQAFIPEPLPPSDPDLSLTPELQQLHAEARSAIEQLKIAGSMVPSIDWFLYGFVRKEAVTTSQIEGTQATLRDVVEFEATEKSERPDDVEEVCNYVHALGFARDELAKPKGMGLGVELLCITHRILMTGVRGERAQPGIVRSTQNWIGGSNPGNAIYVPPPPDDVRGLLDAMAQWIHQDDPLPPLVRAGLAHVQFESIHPFLDGNGRIGRLLIALLLEHWGVLDHPLLYISLAFKQDQLEYYERLTAVRRGGDWEGWTAYFLRCVRLAADDGVRTARELHTLVSADRARVVEHESATIAGVRLMDALPVQPIVTVSSVSEELGITAPTARKAVELLESMQILRETSGKQRDRVYSYSEYMRLLTGEQR
ncbi:MAG: Fic family protein [Phycisphaerales bacterium]|nr:Fic family protein [Phycisphaerales bacterium]